MKNILKTITKLLILIGFIFQIACLPSVKEDGASGEASIPQGFQGAEGGASLSTNSIEVSWESPLSSQDIGAYEVFELDSNNQLVKLSIIDKLTTSYVHQGLLPGTSHRYVVRGLYNDSKTDENFKVISVTTLPTGSNSGPALAISPVNKVLEYNKTFTFAASGGVAPYTYVVLSGPSIIDPNTGELATLATPGNATVRVQDAQGNATYATVSVVAGFTVKPANRQLKFERELDISVIGGKSPYTYTITSGAGIGTVDSAGHFVAGSTPGVVVVTITDADQLTKESVITVVNQMSPHEQTLLSSGTLHSCSAVKGGSEVQCWGDKTHGKLSNSDGIWVGDQAGEMGDNLPETKLGTISAVKDIKSGTVHTCAILDDDRMKCWGYGANGRMGINNTGTYGQATTTVGNNIPYTILGGHTVKKVSTGSLHTCAILDDQSVKCWGSNSYGQLGLGHRNSMGISSTTIGNFLPAVQVK